jgi:hypothetical protein
MSRYHQADNITNVSCSNQYWISHCTPKLAFWRISGFGVIINR